MGQLNAITDLPTDEQMAAEPLVLAHDVKAKRQRFANSLAQINGHGTFDWERDLSTIFSGTLYHEYVQTLPEPQLTDDLDVLAKHARHVFWLYTKIEDRREDLRGALGDNTAMHERINISLQGLWAIRGEVHRWRHRAFHKGLTIGQEES